MLSWGARRQLTIVSVIAICALVAGVTFYLTALRPSPTCTDGVQNQEELATDCGGPCAKVCSMEVTPLVVHWTRFFKLQNGVYDVGALLSNPNVGFGVRSLPYLFRLYDTKNVLLTEKSGVAYVGEKEQFILFGTGLMVGNRVPVRAVVQFGDFTWERTGGKYTKPKFSIENKQLVVEPTPRLSAILGNLETTSVKNIDVTAAVFDEDGNVLGVSATRIDELPRAGTKEVLFTWPHPFDGAPVLSTIYPRVNGFPTISTH